MSAEELKLLFSTPLALFVLMLAASFGSALKQVIVSRNAGTSVRIGEYFFDHWPETLIMMGTNIGAFVTLIMTDSLNYAAAIGIGYLANDAADIFTAKGRSDAMTPTPAQVTAQDIKEEVAQEVRDDRAAGGQVDTTEVERKANEAPEVKP